MSILEKIEIYPYSERANPKPRGYITPGGKPWQAWHPRGLVYWERLADIINREPVHERDRYWMAMLKPLGIEKGKPFNPDERQKKILTEAALVGEAMAKANDFFNPRIEDSHYVEGSMWEYATVCTPNQRREFYDDLDERADGFVDLVDAGEHTVDPGLFAWCLAHSVHGVLLGGDQGGEAFDLGREGGDLVLLGDRQQIANLGVNAHEQLFARQAGRLAANFAKHVVADRKR